LGAAQERPHGAEADEVAADDARGEADPHAGHDHGSGGSETSLELSEQGRKNVGLRLVTVQPRDFDRTISVPAMVKERPGRTEITVSASMTGIVTRIFPIRGEAVSPGDPLFDLRLTHEDLVEKQSSLLRAIEELDVVEREVARLEDVTASGAVAGKRLLEREYEQQKIEAAVKAERQALLLHGLSEEQIQGIIDDRRLLKELTVVAPPMADCQSCDGHEEFLEVAGLSVDLGQHVATGTPLASLTDHCQLYIEGKAFEQDADALNQAASEGVELTALVEGNGSAAHEVPGLRILYVENEVQRESRALKFYVRLPNELVRNEKMADGHRFIGWRYKPGQRVELLVPVERWASCIVLPAEAVVREGPEAFVYQQIGDRFERRSVHVEHRGRQWAVIESDGTLFPGDRVAARGASRIHLALKNRAGGGPDPHAGHHH
jgi:multidrug efflux pump subunit AcrA (membrane-fusion protein)